MVAEQPADLTIRGFGDPQTYWKTDPSPIALPAALNAFVHHLIAAHLRHRGFTAKHLSDELGGSRPTWTNKLNGIRPFSIADVAAIGFAVDPDIWDALPRGVRSAEDLLPPEYVALLSDQELGQGMTRFVLSSISQAAARFSTWWRREITAGREWALTVDVARQRVAAELDRSGLPSREASIGHATFRLRTIDWVARATRLRVLWLFSHDGETPTVEEALKAVGEAFWTPPTRKGGRDLLVIAAPSTVVHNLEIALGFETDKPPSSAIASLQEAHRLGRSDVDAELGDLHLNIHRWQAMTPLWLEIKA